MNQENRKKLVLVDGSSYLFRAYHGLPPLTHKRHPTGARYGGGIRRRKLVADELLGATSALLEPFRFSRYAEGKLHPVSHSPFPWS